jgi:hypothetical protein
MISGKRYYVPGIFRRIYGLTESESNGITRTYSKW